MYPKKMPARNPRRMPPRSRGTHPSLGPARRAPLRTSGPIDQGTAGAIRIIPLGGVEEIGKNMTVIEYENDIVIIDAGFQFPGEEAPGVDYIIPDTTYLAERKQKIRGLIVTHGHLDHIGGIPYILERIGNPPVYCRKLSAALIKKRQDEFPHLPRIDMRIVEKEESITLGNLHARFFAVTHTIPDAMGVVLETPLGNIVHTGDLKVDHQDGVPLPSEEEIFGAVGEGNNLLLMADSTNVEKPGFSYSERAVHENLRKLIKEARARLIIGTFASLLERIIFIIKTAEELGKKIVVEGRSMKINIEIAKELGFLKMNKHTIIPSEEMDSHPPSDIIVLATGAQGDAYAALMRMANRQHKHVKINKTDVVILSSSVIPGNEKTVQKLKDNLSRQGAKILHQAIADVHSSGHAYREEASWIIKKIKPRFFIPVHGYHYMLRVHGEVAEAAGVLEENVIIPDNGMIIEISPDGKTIAPTKKSAPSGIVMIDGLGKGDVKEVVVRDRQVLAQDGMFVIVAVIDVKTGKIRKSPDIISRGFIYLKESQDLLNQTRLLVKKAVEDSVGDMHPINFDYIKNSVRERVGRFLFQETSKRPIIIPVLLEV